MSGKTYSEKGDLVLMDHPQDRGDLLYRLECVVSMKTFDFRDEDEIRQLREMCNELLEEVDNE